MTTTLGRPEEIVRIVAETCVANEQYFSDLDSVVGDGDFGYSLARGFENVIAGWDEIDRTDVATFLQKVALILSSRIGGTSGPIWGTAMLRASSAAKGVDTVDADTVVRMLRSAVEGIKARGGADLGDKTLLDALAPMTDAIEAAAAAGASPSDIAARAAVAARQGAESTTAMVARRGRASYTGDRSVGVIDPGATAVAVLAEEISSRW